MGCGYSTKKTSEQLAHELRRQNDRVNVRIQKMISKSYRHGLLTEFEYNATLGFYFGLKSRHMKTGDQAFINTCDHLYDYLCETIHDRLTKLREEEESKTNGPLPLATPDPPSAPPPTAPASESEWVSPHSQVYRQLITEKPSLLYSLENEK